MYYKSDNWNIGNRNIGNFNTGNRNTGNFNTGDSNTGDFNTGDCNMGCRNTGNWNIRAGNTGNWNTGDFNTGDSNTGNFNTGDYNIGCGNTGNWNTGDGNTGDWNTGDFNNGCFNTDEPKILMFNKPSDMTYMDWIRSDARFLLNQIPKDVTVWVSEKCMNEEEKEENPSYETTGGYLKVIDKSEWAQLWWDNLSEEKKRIIKNIPNFDAEIFRQCTGINVLKGE